MHEKNKVVLLFLLKSLVFEKQVDGNIFWYLAALATLRSKIN
jgi:hypothetical protein